MPDRDGNPSDIEQYEAAAEAAADLAHGAEHLATYYWTGDKASKLDDITNCMVDTPAMDRAAHEVGAAYLQLAHALGAYRTAAKRAIDLATEKAGRHA
jgi:hypothetical protein